MLEHRAITVVPQSHDDSPLNLHADGPELIPHFEFDHKHGDKH